MTDTSVDEAAVEAAKQLYGQFLLVGSEAATPNSEYSKDVVDATARIITDAYTERIRNLRQDVSIGCRWIDAFDKVAVAAGMNESWIESNPEHAAVMVVALLTAKLEVRKKLVGACRSAEPFTTTTIKNELRTALAEAEKL